MGIYFNSLRMKGPKEFKVNEYITLKLEMGETVIYVGGELFNQCRYLFLINPNETIGEEINSIDEAAEKFYSVLETNYFGVCVG